MQPNSKDCIHIHTYPHMWLAHASTFHFLVTHTAMVIPCLPRACPHGGIRGLLFPWCTGVSYIWRRQACLPRACPNGSIRGLLFPWCTGRTSCFMLHSSEWYKILDCDKIEFVPTAHSDINHLDHWQLRALLSTHIAFCLCDLLVESPSMHGPNICK